MQNANNAIVRSVIAASCVSLGEAGDGHMFQTSRRLRMSYHISLDPRSWTNRKIRSTPRSYLYIIATQHGWSNVVCWVRAILRSIPRVRLIIYLSPSAAIVSTQNVLCLLKV